MGVGIYVLKDYELFRKISTDLPDREVLFLNDIYLVSEVLEAYDKNIFIGNQLEISYLKSIIKTLRDDKLKWHKNIYIDGRDLKLFNQDPTILINAYIRLVESNNFLNDAVVMRHIPESLSRRDLLSGDFLEDYVSNIPIIKSVDKCISLDKCDVCRDSCPFDAIKWSKPPEIIHEKCIECGYCINSCPSLLYVYPMLPLMSFELFLKTLRWSGDANNLLLIVDGDIRMDMYETMLFNDVERGISVLHVPKALYFSQYHIALSLAHGYIPVILVDENQPGYTRYSRMVEELNTILKVPVILSTYPSTKSIGIQGIYDYVEDFISSDHRRMFRSIIRFLKKSGNFVELNELNLFDIHVDDEKCTLCEACVRKCPTNALEIEKDEEAVRLVFNPVECIGCRMCDLNCPEDAINIRRGIDLSKYSRDSHSVLVEDSMAHCINCGKPIGPERTIRVLESRMKEAGIDEDYIKSVRLCKTCKSKIYFKDLYGG